MKGRGKRGAGTVTAGVMLIAHVFEAARGARRTRNSCRRSPVWGHRIHGARLPPLRMQDPTRRATARGQEQREQGGEYSWQGRGQQQQQQQEGTGQRRQLGADITSWLEARQARGQQGQPQVATDAGHPSSSSSSSSSSSINNSGVRGSSSSSSSSAAVGPGASGLCWRTRPWRMRAPSGGWGCCPWSAHGVLRG